MEEGRAPEHGEGGREGGGRRRNERSGRGGTVGEVEEKKREGGTLCFFKEFRSENEDVFDAMA